MLPSSQAEEALVGRLFLLECRFQRSFNWCSFGVSLERFSKVCASCPHVLLDGVDIGGGVRVLACRTNRT